MPPSYADGAKNQFQDDLEYLIFDIHTCNQSDEGYVWAFKNALLPELLSALVTSQAFISNDPSKRQEIIKRYNSLTYTLNLIRDFLEKHPSELKAMEV